MTIETAEERAALQAIGAIVAEALQTMGEALRPVLRTAALDAIGAEVLRSHGARSAPQLCYGFPGATCISVNHRVAHGIPGKTVLRSGDLVNIDVSAEKDGFFGDTGASFCVGAASPRREKLCRDGRKVLAKAIAAVRHGRPLNIIGQTLEREARKRGYTLVQNLGSHGVGRSLHEEPGFIAPFHDPDDRRQLVEGMVITIEPFLSTGATLVKQARDGWTLYTEPEYDTVQFEHSLVVTRGQPLILTALN